MDEVGTATLSTEGGELRVTRVGDGLLLRPVGFNLDAWWAELDAYRDVPFMEEGRQQPPISDADDISFD